MCELIAFCFFSKRTGCLVVAALHVIGAVICMVLGAYVLIGMAVDHDSMCRHWARFEIFFGKCYERSRINITCICFLVFSVVQLTCASLMIHGVRKNNCHFMIPFLTMKIIVAILYLVLVIVLAAVTNSYESLGTALVGILVDSYVIASLHSYYTKLKSGTADNELKLTESSQTDNRQVRAPTADVSGRCSQSSSTLVSLA